MCVKEIKKGIRDVYRKDSADGFWGKAGTAVQAAVVIGSAVCLVWLMIR